MCHIHLRWSCFFWPWKICLHFFGTTFSYKPFVQCYDHFFLKLPGRQVRGEKEGEELASCPRLIQVGVVQPLPMPPTHQSFNNRAAPNVNLLLDWKSILPNKSNAKNLPNTLNFDGNIKRKSSHQWIIHHLSLNVFFWLL